MAHPSRVVLMVLFGVEWLIRARWDVPVWSFLAVLVLTIALDVQVVLGRFQEHSRPLRPLTLTSLALAGLFTILVLLSDTPSDRWFLLAWLVPGTTALAEKLWRHPPNTTLVRITSGLLAVVIVGQLWLAWQTHHKHERASAFRNTLDQICAYTAGHASGDDATWMAANEWLIAELRSLNAPDPRTRQLTDDLAENLVQSEVSLRANDRAKLAEWQQLSRQIAGYLHVSTSCGVF